MLRTPGFPIPGHVLDAIKATVQDHVGVWQLSAIYELLAQIGQANTDRELGWSRRTYRVEGEVVDLGCGDGRWSALMQWMLNDLEIPKEVICYDPFPVEPISPLNCVRSEVQCNHDSGVEMVLTSFRARDLSDPRIVPGWYQQTLASELPDQIAFVHMGVAQREDISCCLNAVYPRMPEGAILVAEGYGLGLSKCVQPAVDAFLTNKPEQIELTVSGIQGAFKKQRLS